MISYPHFALTNLYLANGYREVETPYGPAREYTREAELEQCVRCVLLRKPERLRGWDLRFLRNGLSLSQTEFGQMVDRDAQTVARWEKSTDPVPKFVDQIIRTRFAAEFEPGMGIEELLSYVDCIARKLPEKIRLSLTDAGWTFDFEQKIKSLSLNARADARVRLPGGYGFVAKVYVAERYSDATGSVDPTVSAHQPGEGLVITNYKLEQLATHDRTNDVLVTSSKSTSIGTFYVPANSTAH